MPFRRSTKRHIDTALMAIVASTMHEVLRWSGNRIVPSGQTETTAEWMSYSTLLGMCSALLPDMPVYVGGHLPPSGLPQRGTYLIALAIDEPERFRAGAEDGLSTMVAYVHRGEVVAAVIGDIFYGEIFALKYETGRVLLHAGKDASDLAELDARHLLGTALVAMGDMDGYPQAIHDLIVFRKEGDEVITMAEGQGPLNTLPILWRTRAGSLVWPEVGQASRLVLLPVIAINRALGFVTLQPTDGGRFRPVTMLPWAQPGWLEGAVLTVHRSVLFQVPGMSK